MNRNEVVLEVLAHAKRMIANYCYMVIVFFLVLVSIIWLIIPDRDKYTCNKCGFSTNSDLEAAGHEKLENMHKCA